jgi:hypothetical protein
MNKLLLSTAATAVIAAVVACSGSALADPHRGNHAAHFATYPIAANPSGEITL